VCAVALAGSALFAVTAPAATAEPTPTAAPSEAAVPDIDALRERADAVKAELVESTEAWEAGKERFEAAEAEAERVRDEVDAARRAFEAARVELGAYAAAAYRQQAIPVELTVLLADADVADSLHALSVLDVTGAVKTDVVAIAQDLADEVSELEATARRLADEAEREADRLAEDLAAVQAAAKRSTDELTAGLAEIERIEREKREAAARAEALRLAAERKASRAAARAASRAAGGESAPAGKCTVGADATAGYSNGLIPTSALCSIGIGDHLLRADAAVAFRELAAAYRGRFGSTICVNDAYRTLAEQYAVFAATPDLAAVPGTSNHGWGVAIDLGCGINQFGTAQHTWMRANAERFGWFHPAWARAGGSMPEAWHWEFSG
jgi:LAS superfamily LD-carboxypeptidase LdcB